MASAGPTTEERYWDRFRNTAMGEHLLAHEVEFLRRALVAEDAPPRVLELGACGGRITLPLRDSMSTLVAVDIDHDALRVFHARSGLQGILADAQRLPFAVGTFDCVVAIQCLRYFDTQQFLSECHEVLSPNGLLVLQAVNRRGYKRRLKELVHPRKRIGGSTRSGDEVLRSIVDAGFEVGEVEGYNWLPFPADSSRLANTSLVGLAAAVESKIGLGRHRGLSPWILVKARKQHRRSQSPLEGPIPPM